MNNKSVEWQREFYLTHDKYRMQRQGTDCYKVVKGLTRILQLPTIAKLTTDNESVISDFRLNSGEYGLEPYDEYAIKVDDTYGASFYILVHRRADTTFLCPILVGFEGENTCAMVKPTDNWRMREMKAFVELKRAEKEFGVEGLMMAVSTQNGVYGCLSVLNESGNLLERWLRTERDSLHIRNSVTAPSSAALILQIWLHTICLWKRRCLSRKVEQRIVHANGEQESVKDVRECLNTSKQTIVDLKKGIVVYVNDGAGKRAFAGFCVLQSERCGHFRHLQSGKVVYVRPTTVHYKKLNPKKAINQTAKPVIYRNTEDFLREKSYLENDVLMMLKCNGIEYQREKMFPWMGKKRLDFFLPGKNIAIECQGVQHFYAYGSDDRDFEARKQRDTDKYNECTGNGVQVLYYMSDMIPLPDEMAKKYRYVTSLIYGLVHDKAMFRPELDLANAHPKEFDNEHIFPLDMFINSDYMLKLSREEFAKELERLFDEDKIGYAQVVVATDIHDLHRIVVLTDTTQKDKLSRIAVSLFGVPKREAKRIIAKYQAQ